MLSDKTMMFDKMMLIWWLRCCCDIYDDCGAVMRFMMLLWYDVNYVLMIKWREYNDVVLMNMMYVMKCEE